MSNLFKIHSPLNGTTAALDSVPDAVFSERVLGDGCAIIPTDGKIYSPVDGEISSIAETNHAYGFSSDDGLEILVHFGLETVALKGEGFKPLVAVGDKVTFGSEVPLEQISLENPAVITAVSPRKNYIIRKSTNLSRQSHIIAANLDRAFIIATIDYPEIKLPFLDRILVTCEVYNVPVTIVLNKVDLYRESHKEMLEAFHEIYEGAGYEVMEVSALTGEGVDALREACKGNVSLFSGVSGVGKSSLIKALDPSLDPRVGEISDVHLQGKHTTTFYEMYPLSSGGFIVDTPGLRGFGLVDLKKEEIALYFPEMLKASADCRFSPCTHTHEPGCAVKEAVEAGEISYDRYSSYLGMLDEEGKYR